MDKKREELKNKIFAIIPENSVGRYDLLPIFRDMALFKEIVSFLCYPFRDKIDFVVGPEAMGWILGTAMALELNAGFLPVRKGNRLPYEEKNLKTTKFIDYSKQEKTLQIALSSTVENANVLIVDDWIETGSQIKGVISLFDSCNIKGIASIGINYNSNTGEWIDSNLAHYICRED